VKFFSLLQLQKLPKIVFEIQMIYILKGLINFGQGMRDMTGQLAVTIFLPQILQYLSAGIFESSGLFRLFEW
jgi:hypothetical protein